MHLTSLFGILALLGLAWAMSYHRTKVNLRTVFWGLGLQVLFATIILSEATWSFIGMGAFAALLATYILRGTDPERIASWPVTGAWIVGIAVAAAAVSSNHQVFSLDFDGILGGAEFAVGKYY